MWPNFHQGRRFWKVSPGLVRGSVKKLHVVIGSLGIAVGAVLVAGWLWWQSQVSPVSPGNTQTTPVIIPKEATAGQAIDKLQDNGLIKSTLAAKLYVKLTGLDKKIQNGTFDLSPGQDLVTMVHALTVPAKDVWVTIPEGFRMEQIALRLDSTLTGPEKAFDLVEFVQLAESVEGQLFPDTYLIPRYATAEQIIGLMQSTFVQRVGEVSRSDLILASLVEREGKTDTDRPIIAGIMHNRLQASWPLQIDATVQYGRDSVICGSNLEQCDWWAPLMDTKFVSSYNTYLQPGLPPGPIANPGMAAIQAAINPTQTPYWYYIHAPDGTAYYAVTLADHSANIDKYLEP